MKNHQQKELIIAQLEELAGKLGINVLHEKITTEESAGSGGLCRWKGEYVLIIHSQASVEEKIRILRESLKPFPLGDIYVKPVIRDLLEESNE